MCEYKSRMELQFKGKCKYASMWYVVTYGEVGTVQICYTFGNAETKTEMGPVIIGP